MSSPTDIIFAIWDSCTTTQAASRFHDLLADPLNSQFTDVGRAQIMTQLARTIGLQNSFEDAHKLLDEAETIMVNETHTSVPNDPEPAVLKARLEIERGRVYNSGGMPARSETHFVDAYQHAIAAVGSLALTAQDATQSNASYINSDVILSYLAVDALHMLAIVADSNAKRAQYARQGIEIAMKSTDARTKSWLGPLLNNLGWEMLESGDSKGAIEVLQQAADVRREALDMITSNTGEGHDPDDRARTKAFTAWKIAVWSVGHAQMQGGREEEALQTLSSLLLQNADGPSIREDLAHLCAGKGDGSAAVAHARRALELGVSGKQADSLHKLIATFPDQA